MTPTDHKSVLYEYSFFFNDYGAMYNGDPTLYLLGFDSSSFFIANPKSAILHSSFSVIKMLAGLRSL